MIMLTGATGYVGRFLWRRLVSLEIPFRCLVRASSDCTQLRSAGVECSVADLDDPASVKQVFSGVDRVVHLAHMRYARTLAESLPANTRHVVWVSSLRRFSTVASASVAEIISGESEAEKAVSPGVILRPAMIYGPGDDRNISRLAARLKRKSWIPVFGRGVGLQQPVYVEDAVDGILSALLRPSTAGKTYALAGAEAVTYNRLLDLVGEAVGVRPRKIYLPLRPSLAVLWLLQRAKVTTPILTEQIRRLQEDKAVSLSAARSDLDYSPLALKAGLARIYGGNGFGAGRSSEGYE